MGQTQGFVESIFDLMGLDLPVLEHSTVCRRVKKLNIVIPVKPTREGMHLVVDSGVGLKYMGVGEWKTRIDGVGKPRTWRKLHLGVNETTG
ncbi:MAG: transposase, partial [Cyanobacteria bacterium P01_H01_bin.35]